MAVSSLSMSVPPTVATAFDLNRRFRLRLQGTTFSRLMGSPAHYASFGCVFFRAHCALELRFCPGCRSFHTATTVCLPGWSTRHSVNLLVDILDSAFWYDSFSFPWHSWSFSPCGDLSNRGPSDLAKTFLALSLPSGSWPTAQIHCPSILDV